MAAKFWSNVAVAVQSALATAITFTGITKANPGVGTYTGTDPSNGDYVLLSVTGMHQVNNKIVRVANVNAGSNTFEFEGVDTTLYDTFSAGTGQVITFGTTLSTLTNISASGGDYEEADVTTIHDTQRSVVPTVASPISFDFESRWEVSDAGLVALKTASDSKVTRCVRFTFSNGSKFLFNAYVGCSLSPTGQAQDVVKTSVTLKAQGTTTVYSS